jgi:hypothetical protein
MARPRVSEEPRRVKSVRLPVSTLEALKRAAKLRRVSENQLVEWAVTDLLSQLDRDDQQPRLWTLDVPSEAS